MRLETFKSDRLKFRCEFTEEMLGTANSNPDIHDQFIASKAPDAPSREEEIEALGTEEYAEKSLTVFPIVDGKPIVWDYQIKGFFKSACSMLGRIKDSKSSELKAFKKIIDGGVFVYPRAIELKLPDGGIVGECQRPLRAQTPQGERVALANSLTVPAGTIIEFEVEIPNLKSKKEKDFMQSLVFEWLGYGQKWGLGQWRNSGKGRFVCDYLGTNSAL